MSRYKKEIGMIQKALDLNHNNPMTYTDLRKVLFNVKDNVFMIILSDMLVEKLLVYKNDRYQLPPIEYDRKNKEEAQKRLAIIQANNRIIKIRDQFVNKYYSIADAKSKYFEVLNSCDDTNFEIDMKNIGYTIYNGYLIAKFTTTGEYLISEIQKQSIINIEQFKQIFKPLVESVDFNYTLEKLKQNYSIIEFEKGSYINIKHLNSIGIYISDIKSYCTAICEFKKDGSCFSIKSLRKEGFENKLDDLGMEDIFYENILKYDGRLIQYKMTHCYVFSTKKKPSVSNITYDILKNRKTISIYELQDILKKQFGIATSFVSENGTLVNQSLLFEENTQLYYSKEFEKIYFDKNDFYEEIEYDE